MGVGGSSTSGGMKEAGVGREKGERGEKQRESEVKKVSKGTCGTYIYVCMYISSKPSVKLTTNTPICNTKLNVFPMNEQSMNHSFLKDRSKCYAKSPTVWDTFQPISSLCEC